MSDGRNRPISGLRILSRLLLGWLLLRGLGRVMHFLHRGLSPQGVDHVLGFVQLDLELAHRVQGDLDLVRHLVDTHISVELGASSTIPLRAQGIQLPQGVFRQDEIFGKVMVLDGLIELQTTLPPGQELEVRYQGCAEQGYCYPPQKKILTSANMLVNPLK